MWHDCVLPTWRPHWPLHPLAGANALLRHLQRSVAVPSPAQQRMKTWPRHGYELHPREARNLHWGLARLRAHEICFCFKWISIITRWALLGCFESQHRQHILHILSFPPKSFSPMLSLPFQICAPECAKMVTERSFGKVIAAWMATSPSPRDTATVPRKGPGPKGNGASCESCSGKNVHYSGLLCEVLRVLCDLQNKTLPCCIYQVDAQTPTPHQKEQQQIQKSKAKKRQPSRTWQPKLSWQGHNPSASWQWKVAPEDANSSKPRSSQWAASSGPMLPQSLQNAMTSKNLLPTSEDFQKRKQRLEAATSVVMSIKYSLTDLMKSSKHFVWGPHGMVITMVFTSPSYLDPGTMQGNMLRLSTGLWGDNQPLAAGHSENSDPQPILGNLAIKVRDDPAQTPRPWCDKANNLGLVECPHINLKQLETSNLWNPLGPPSSTGLLAAGFSRSHLIHTTKYDKTFTFQSRYSYLVFSSHLI